VKLTKKEQEMIDGEYGDAVQGAMELMVAVGECYDAEQFVPVASAHLSSANPVTVGKGGITLIKDMAKRGGKFVIPTTMNPACIEPWAWQEMGFSEELFREQMTLSEVFAKMGGFVCNTCTPYLIGHVPRMREHIAWGESSAVVYTNAILGSRTNREGAPTVLAAALTGRTPAYGYHLDDNRYGKLKIIVNANLKGDTDYATLGYFAGGIAKDKVPIFTGIPPSVSNHELKCLGAALATSGSVSHYHVVGVTPEAPTEEVGAGFKTIGSSNTFGFGSKEIKETEESLSKIGPEGVDLVVLGCPHASIDQIKQYAEAFSGRRVKSEVEIWILIPNGIKKYAEDIGYANIIESTGTKLVCNTCPVIMPRDFFRSRGYRAIATDSPKMIYYISATKDVPCYYASLDKFIDVVTNKM
jgi:predicted aconitase